MNLEGFQKFSGEIRPTKKVGANRSDAGIQNRRPIVALIDQTSDSARHVGFPTEGMNNITLSNL
jgi:hypothetical protein